MTIAQRIYNQALKDGIPKTLSLFLVAQGGHETAGFTSHVFLGCNNAFGYKWIGQSTANGSCTNAPEGGVYASYDSVEESTHEITQWIRRRQSQGKFPANLDSITTLSQYAALLKSSGYYGDTVANYAHGLTYWFDRLPIATKATGAGLLLLAAGAILYYKRKQLFGKKKSLYI